MTQSLDEAMSRFAPELPLGVALSGGADSTALLLACAARWPGQVHAVHVHHGLQAAADNFAAHCAALCAAFQVPLTVQHVDASHAPGQSPEEAARSARYASFSSFAGVNHAKAAIKNIAIAQHADDQVETLLLALSRGAGLAGLAAMPARWIRNGVTYHRPLLAVAAADLRAWLLARGACWIEDPTNTNEQFTRNRIRARLLPALDAAFPQFRDTFTRSSTHAAQARELLRELAVEDLLGVEGRGGVGSPPGIAALQALSAARQANVLRHWLSTVHATTPSAAQLAELLAQIAACTTRGHRIHMKVGRGFVQRDTDRLGWYNPGVLA